MVAEVFKQLKQICHCCQGRPDFLQQVIGSYTDGTVCSCGNSGTPECVLLPVTTPHCCPCRALEAVGLAPKGQGGAYVEQQYTRLLGPLEHQQQQQERPAVWPVNTHGGLLGFGAPWEVPAMISLVEAVAQLRGEVAGRQVEGAARALVYGNGGIFSASAVAILQGLSQCGPSKL